MPSFRERLKSWGLPWFGPSAGFGLGGGGAGRRGIAQRGSYTITEADYARSVAVVVAAWVVRATHGLQVEEVDNAGKTVRTSPVAETLNDPESFFLPASIIDRSLYGNAFFDRREPGVIRYIPYVNVRPLRPKAGKRVSTELHGIQVRYNGYTEDLLPEDYIHIRNGVDPLCPYWGRSPLAGVADDIASDSQASRTAAIVLRKIARVGVVAMPAEGAQDFRDNDVAAVTDMLREQHAGDDAGGEWVSPVRVDLQYPKPMSLDGLEMERTRWLAEDRVCAALGVQSAVVGLSSGLRNTKVGATMTSMRLQTWQGGIIPLLADIANDAGASLGVGLRVPTDAVLARIETPRERAARLAMLTKAGIITPAKALSELVTAGDVTL